MRECTLTFLAALLVQQVLKILGKDDGVKKLLACSDAQTLCAVFEKAAKTALKRTVSRLGHDKAADDPAYAHLRGKIDSKYIRQLTIAWLWGETLLAWLNNDYHIVFSSNAVYARMALKRVLLNETDRRAVMINNRRAIEANPYLKNLVSGASAEEIAEIAVSYTHLTLPTICSV